MDSLSERIQYLKKFSGSSRMPSRYETFKMAVAISRTFKELERKHVNMQELKKSLVYALSSIVTEWKDPDDIEDEDLHALADFTGYALFESPLGDDVKHVIYFDQELINPEKVVHPLNDNADEMIKRLQAAEGVGG